MRFMFDFKGIPSFGYTCYGTAEMEARIKQIIENEPHRLKCLPNIGFDVIDLVEQLLIDQVGSKQTRFDWTYSEVNDDSSGEEVRFCGELKFDSKTIENLENVNLDNAFKEAMLHLLNDPHGDCNYLDFSALDKVVEELGDGDDGYSIVVEIDESDVTVATKFVN